VQPTYEDVLEKKAIPRFAVEVEDVPSSHELRASRAAFS
jgi:hypothetical protein